MRNENQGIINWKNAKNWTGNGGIKICESIVLHEKRLVQFFMNFAHK